MNREAVYFVMQTEVTKKNHYIPCIAVKGEKGYYKTDWTWNCTYDQANEHCQMLNEQMGFSPEDTMIIIMSTMNRK